MKQFITVYLGGILLAMLFLFTISYLVLQESKIKDLQLVNEGFQTKLNTQQEEIDKLRSRIDEINNVTVKATAYNAVASQTDDDPDTTSCLVKPTVGSIAVSQDLFYKGWTCGKKVKIKNLGIFTVTDVMHYRKKEQIDIIKETEDEAIDFGIKENLNAVLMPAYENM